MVLNSIVDFSATSFPLQQQFGPTHVLRLLLHLYSGPAPEGSEPYTGRAILRVADPKMSSFEIKRENKIIHLYFHYNL